MENSSKNSTLSNSLDELADLFENGHLEMSANPEGFLKEVCLEITRLRERISLLRRSRTPKEGAPTELVHKAMYDQVLRDLEDSRVEIEVWKERCRGCQASLDAAERKIKELRSPTPHKNCLSCGTATHPDRPCWRCKATPTESTDG
jgi:hypothetical protein